MESSDGQMHPAAASAGQGKHGDSRKNSLARCRASSGQIVFLPQGIQRQENRNSAELAETSMQTRKGNIMKTTLHSIQRFLRDEDGIVAIEYGLMAVLIALALAAGAALLGSGLSTLFSNIADCFTGGAACPVPLPAPL